MKQRTGCLLAMLLLPLTCWGALCALLLPWALDFFDASLDDDDDLP